MPVLKHSESLILSLFTSSHARPHTHTHAFTLRERESELVVDAHGPLEVAPTGREIHLHGRLPVYTCGLFGPYP